MTIHRRGGPVASLLSAALAALLIGLPVSSARAADAVRISGSGSGLGGMELLAQAFMREHPDHLVEVLPTTGSRGGVAAVLAGALELAVANRPPTAAQMAERALVVTEYARSPLVVVVHRELGVTALTSAHLAALFGEGAQTYSNGKRARPVLRGIDTADFAVIKTISPAVAAAFEGAAARRGMLVAATDSEAADMAERVPGAFAFITLAQLATERRPLIALPLDGRVPSTANLVSGTYPYFKTLYLVSRADAAAPVRQFIAFVGSPAGRRLLEAHGHLVR
jgi:phosphate transport system substrate-binding protein